jgi:hypothetical protein
MTLATCWINKALRDRTKWFNPFRPLVTQHKYGLTHGCTLGSVVTLKPGEKVVPRTIQMAIRPERGANRNASEEGHEDCGGMKVRN